MDGFTLLGYARSMTTYGIWTMGKRKIDGREHDCHELHAIHTDKEDALADAQQRSQRAPGKLVVVDSHDSVDDHEQIVFLDGKRVDD